MKWYGQYVNKLDVATTVGERGSRTLTVIDPTTETEPHEPRQQRHGQKKHNPGQTQIIATSMEPYSLL